MERKHICDISPTEFEKCCFKILNGYAEEEKLMDFEITHNKIIRTSDGKYQIDIYAEFTALGSQFKVLCECKRYKYRVNREKVEILHSKLESIGAQKGLLISTSDFQSGAIEYAQAHGIASIKVSDYHFEFLSHSSGQLEIDDNDPFLYAEKNWPFFEAFDYTTRQNEPRKVYPTKTMIEMLQNEQKKLIKEKLDIDVDFA